MVGKATIGAKHSRGKELGIYTLAHSMTAFKSSVLQADVPVSQFGRTIIQIVIRQ
jgi:hypothetical protein